MPKYIKSSYNLLAESMPQMPKVLPVMLKTALSSSTEHMRPAFANGVFPSLMAQMHNVRFRYPDNVTHEPHMMTVLVGPQSVGKGGLNPIVRVVTRKMREHDKESESKLNEWRRACKTKGANAQKPASPSSSIQQPMVIQLGITPIHVRVIKHKILSRINQRLKK